MIEKVVSGTRMNSALDYVMSKKDMCGFDGMHTYELPKYLKEHKEELRQKLLKGEWKPGLVQQREIVMKNGKTRIISNFNAVDRYVSTCIYQEIYPLAEKEFSSCSYAYRKNKSALEAAKKCCGYASEGYDFCGNINYLNCFDNIDTEILSGLLNDLLKDRKLTRLIISLVQPDTVFNHEIRNTDKGILQGSVLSPLLCNLYLTEVDRYMEKQGIRFVRYADDIRVFGKTYHDCEAYMKDIERFSKEKLKLPVNQKKAKIELSAKSRYFGYILKEENGKLNVKKYSRKKDFWYYEWTPSPLSFTDGQLHILEDGVLSRKDFTLLFENESMKEFIPAESIMTVNAYGNIVLSPSVLSFLNSKKIGVNFFDDHMSYIGSFIPAGYTHTAGTFLKQACIYNDPQRRWKYAYELEYASVRNMMAVIRYYARRMDSDVLKGKAYEIRNISRKLKKTGSVNQLMILEAQAREIYYSCFGSIITDPDFVFNGRNKLPPKDPLNSLISFGNTFLYNRISSCLYRSQLDNRISFVHSAERRTENLSYDLADVYKPVVVDRVIFTLVNKKMLDAEEHFEYLDDGGVYLNKEGCSIIVKALKQKLASRISYKGKKASYIQHIQNDIHALAGSVNKGTDDFKPYSEV